MPASLRTVESASEDIIDLALAGKRAEVVQQSQEARGGGQGPGERGVEASVRHVSRSWRRPRPLLDVALASNRVFALVPGFFARYETSVPASVTRARLPRLRGQARVARARHGQAACRRSTGSERHWDSRAPAGGRRARGRPLRRAREGDHGASPTTPIPRGHSVRPSTASTWSTSWRSRFGELAFCRGADQLEVADRAGAEYDGVGSNSCARIAGRDLGRRVRDADHVLLGRLRAAPSRRRAGSSSSGCEDSSFHDSRAPIW